MSEIDAVAATQGPGLPTALLVGFKAAQEHRVRAPQAIRRDSTTTRRIFIRRGLVILPRSSRMFRSIVSGGHTILVAVQSELKHQVLGATIDDAAGECFDKTGKLMGLPYPAGPEIDKLAEQGNPKAFDFPRPLLNDGSDDFSFSGLKTSVRYFLRDHPDLLTSPHAIRDLCASIQAAIVDVLVAKTIRAAKRTGVRCVTASGGVTCNRELRKQLEQACKRNGFGLRLAEKGLCTDNAGMIGILAERKFLAGSVQVSLDQEIMPGLALA